MALDESCLLMRLKNEFTFETMTLGEMGLVMKSSAPNSNPLTCESSSFKAVKNDDGILKICL